MANTTETFEPTLDDRRRARTAVMQYKSIPVVVVPGDQPPAVMGESYYWTWTPNPAGTRARTNAGRRKYRTYYHASTRRVEVGAGWLIARRTI